MSLSIGICGVGNWGSKHHRVFHKLIGPQNIYVYDQNIERARRICAGNGGNIANSLDELLLWSKGVVVAVPTPSHSEVAEICLSAGKHVLVEKPMASTQEEATNLVRCSKLKDRLLITDHILVHHPAVKKIIEIVRSGTIGDVVFYDAVRTNFGWRIYGEDVINGVMLHDIYLVEHILNQEIYTVKGDGISLARPKYEKKFDDATVIGTTMYGIPFRLRSSWITSKKERVISIIGTKGTIRWDDMLGKDGLQLTDQRVDLLANKLYERTKDPVIEFEYIEPLEAVALDFLNCIQSKKYTIVTPEDGYRAVSISEAIRTSIIDNIAVRLV